MLDNKFSLSKKYCLITGAAGLLGIEHAEAILEVNGNVILTDLNTRKLKNKVERMKIKFKNSNILYFKMDVSKLSDIKKVFNKLQKAKIDVDILINNAAVDAKVKKGFQKNFNSFEKFSIKEWEKQIAVGLTGSMLCSKVFGSSMSRRNGGVILNIASDLSVIAPDQRLYTSKKKKELQTYNILSN
tara:strand:- start:40 stop:597 length:558 start_codon:yes stop_codon:yes gene_type:complete